MHKHYSVPAISTFCSEFLLSDPDMDQRTGILFAELEQVDSMFRDDLHSCCKKVDEQWLYLPCVHLKGVTLT